jgi:hypothetical protein
MIFDTGTGNDVIGGAYWVLISCIFESVLQLDSALSDPWITLMTLGKQLDMQLGMITKRRQTHCLAYTC